MGMQTSWNDGEDSTTKFQWQLTDAVNIKLSNKDRKADDLDKHNGNIHSINICGRENSFFRNPLLDYC